MADVWLRGVSKSFGEVAAVRDLNLHISDGEFVVAAGADRRRQDDDAAPDRRT